MRKLGKGFAAIAMAVMVVLLALPMGAFAQEGAAEGKSVAIQKEAASDGFGAQSSGLAGGAVQETAGGSAQKDAVSADETKDDMAQDENAAGDAAAVGGTAAKSGVAQDGNAIDGDAADAVTAAPTSETLSTDEAGILPFAEPLYSVDDIKVINKIIDDHSLSWTKAPENGSAKEEDFATWQSLNRDGKMVAAVTWSQSGAGRRIISLFTAAGQGALDVSALTALKKLDLHPFSGLPGEVTSLNVSGCTALEELDCSGNKLTLLDLSKNTALKVLYCDNNPLSTLDISGTALTTFRGVDTTINSLNASNCKSLTRLTCIRRGGIGALTNLNVSGCTALKTLECDYNQLTSLDVKDCAALTELGCSINQLPSLDVSKNTALTELWCGGNELTTIDLSKNGSLTPSSMSQYWLSNQNVSLTMSAGSGNSYTSSVLMDAAATFTDDGGALSYAGGTLTSTNSAANNVQFTSPTGKEGFSLSGRMALSYPGTHYTISFDANVSSPPANWPSGLPWTPPTPPASIATGVDGSVLSLPTMSGPGVFIGWYDAATDGNLVTKDTVFTGDTTLYAHWVPFYIITLDANGGQVYPVTMDTNSNAKVYSLPTPTRSGFHFDGWYDAATGGNLVTVDTVFTGDTTLYAHWTAYYVITFDVNGGQNQDSMYANLNGKLPYLPTPRRSGFNFDGWYDAVTGGNLVTVDTVFTGDTTLYAHWTSDPNTVWWDSANNAYTQGSGTGLTHVSSHDFALHNGVVQVDGITRTQGVDYTAAAGSTRITLLPAFLSTLSAGTHTLRVGFSAGTSDVVTTFTVEPSSSTGNTPTDNTPPPPTNGASSAPARSASSVSASPKTGDEAPLGLYGALMLGAAFAAALCALTLRRKQVAKQ